MESWYVYDPERGLQWHHAAASAQMAAQLLMDAYDRGARDGGWPDEGSTIEWGRLVVVERAVPVGAVGWALRPVLTPAVVSDAT